MPSIRVTAFSGLAPEVHTKLTNKTAAQVAHNCLLWDGRLRPMPEFVVYRTLPDAVYGLTTSLTYGDLIYSFDMMDITISETPPITQGVVGVATSSFSNGRNLAIRLPADGANRPLSIDAPVVLSVTNYIVGMSRSESPRMVSYAITGVRANSDESAPLVLFSVGSAGEYMEGDAVGMTVTLDTTWITDNNIVLLNVYKTISNISSGEQVANPFDTSWHLLFDYPADSVLASAGELNFSDDGMSYRYGLDLLPSKEFYTELSTPTTYVTALDSGWLCAASFTSLQFSEKYLWHAFPVRNLVSIPATITGMVSKYDTVFVGTTTHPYSVRVSSGEGGNLQLDVRPYPEAHRCVQGSMVSTGNGAMYVSNEGIVALSPEGMTVASKELLNPGDTLYTKCGASVPFTVTSITGAEWMFGRYFGFTFSTELAFWYDPGDSINGAHPFQQLITMDIPMQARAATVSPRYGLALAAANVIYLLPLPGYKYQTDYSVAPKKRYRWKSKRFVMPGHTAFSALKVVRECEGDVCITIWADCRRVLTYSIDDAQPLRLPDAVQGVEFEFELEGTAAISEVHIATSIRELTEHE